mgnify:FL=1
MSQNDSFDNRVRVAAVQLRIRSMIQVIVDGLGVILPAMQKSFYLRAKLCKQAVTIAVTPKGSYLLDQLRIVASSDNLQFRSSAAI